MKLSKNRGICHLCGKVAKLTFEHIPPESTFNNQSTKMYSGSVILDANNERMPWEVHGLRYIPFQRGKGAYTLCDKCNNITGSWYGSHYSDYIHTVSHAIQTNKQSVKDPACKGMLLGIKNVNPLAIIKQVLSMFCSVNPNNISLHLNGLIQGASAVLQQKLKSLDFSSVDNDIKAFVLDKDSNDFDTNKYTIASYISKGPMERYCSFFIIGNFDKASNTISTAKVVSEIATYPLGFLLYINVPKDCRSAYHGTDISEFTQFSYYESKDIEIAFPIYETNSYIPDDHRTKEELIRTKNENEIKIGHSKFEG